MKSCKVYHSCAEVPDGKVMNGCRPAYTSKGSKNWAHCNMATWGKPGMKKYCKSQKKCKMSKHLPISEDQVDVEVLHRKMPVIWRHLDRKTRRKIVKLARKV
jgi:hypothetical protein